MLLQRDQLERLGAFFLELLSWHSPRPLLCPYMTREGIQYRHFGATSVSLKLNIK
jgi:hypothetical protein